MRRSTHGIVATSPAIFRVEAFHTDLQQVFDFVHLHGGSGARAWGRGGVGGSTAQQQQHSAAQRSTAESGSERACSLVRTRACLALAGRKGPQC